jgi:DNA-binding NarL/FixJ family response regulator
MTRRIRVLIVDDHNVFAQGLALLLAASADLDVVGTAATAADAHRIAERERPDVVLMDFRLPDGTGAEAASRIHTSVPAAAVVMLSADSGDDAVLTAVEAGAVGYLLKTEAAASVVTAVRRAADGEVLLPPTLLAGLVARQRNRAREASERRARRDLLTGRERDVLGLMAEGLDNKAIAARLAISLHTARGYIQSLLEKLGAHSKLEAVVRASQLGLLSPDD